MPLPERQPSPFDRLRARALFGWSALASALVIAFSVLAARSAHERVDARVLALLIMLAVLLVLLVRARRAGLSWRQLFGPPPARTMLPLLLVVVPVGVITFASALLVFVPLSYVFPRWVERQLLSASLLDARTLTQWLVLAIGAAVVAPLMEEMLFRGLLLQRWARRWGTPTGVVASSLLFAVGHSEIPGHFLFGVAMAALYLRTRRLWVPMAAHALNNLVLMLPILANVMLHKRPEVETIATLRRELWLAPPMLVLGVALLVWYVRRWWPGGMVREVLSGPVPYEVERSDGLIV